MDIGNLLFDFRPDLRPEHIEEMPSWMSDEKKCDVIKEGINRTSKHWDFVFFVASAGVFVGMVLLVGWLFSQVCPNAPSWMPWIVFTPIAMLAGFAMVHGQKRKFVRSIRQVLREHGVNICPKCAYSLSELPREATCPECGLTVAEMAKLGPVVRGWKVHKSQCVCDRCGYNLHGLLDGKPCPECGNLIEGAPRRQPQE